VEAEHERGQREDLPGAGAGSCPHQPAQGERRGPRRPPVQRRQDSGYFILNYIVLSVEYCRRIFFDNKFFMNSQQSSCQIPLEKLPLFVSLRFSDQCSIL
jgi:hypothetical protein